MRGVWVGIVSGVGLAVVGCAEGVPPAPVLAPASLLDAYPARTDFLVDSTPTVPPPRWNTLGFPPLKSLALGEANTPDPEQVRALAPELGKAILKPASADAGDRAKLAAALGPVFGTPLRPTVELPAAAALKLDPATLAAGAGVYRRHCVSCHGPAGAGDGPASTTLHPPPRDYRPGVFKFATSSPNTPGKPRRQDLATTVRRGLQGSMMPAFPDLAAADVDAVVSYVIHLSVRGEAEFAVLKALVKAEDDVDVKQELAKAATKALDRWQQADTVPMRDGGVPPDPTTDHLAAAARGKELFLSATGAGCAACHVNYGRSPNLKYDQWGNVIQPRNLTLGLYRGGRSPEDIYARLYVGIAGAGMPSHKQLVDPPAADGADKIWDLVHFVQALSNPADRAALKIE